MSTVQCPWLLILVAFGSIASTSVADIHAHAIREDLGVLIASAHRYTILYLTSIALSAGLDGFDIECTLLNPDRFGEDHSKHVHCTVKPLIYHANKRLTSFPAFMVFVSSVPHLCHCSPQHQLKNK